jgi:hypothetical protein
MYVPQLRLIKVGSKVSKLVIALFIGRVSGTVLIGKLPVKFYECSLNSHTFGQGSAASSLDLPHCSLPS